MFTTDDDVEISRLRAENADLKRDCELMGACIERLQAEINRLSYEVRAWRTGPGQSERHEDDAYTGGVTWTWYPPKR